MEVIPVMLPSSVPEWMICQVSASCVIYAVAGMEADFTFTLAFWIGILWLFCANVASLSHSVPIFFTGMPFPLTYKLNVPLFARKQELLKMDFMKVTQERQTVLLATYLIHMVTLPGVHYFKKPTYILSHVVVYLI